MRRTVLMKKMTSLVTMWQRSTTAVGHTPSWLSLCEKFRKVHLAKKHGWSPWAQDRWVWFVGTLQVAFPRVGIFLVNPRFHPRPVGWNLGLAWKFQTSVFLCVFMCISFYRRAEYLLHTIDKGKKRNPANNGAKEIGLGLFDDRECSEHIVQETTLTMHQGWSLETGLTVLVSCFDERSYLWSAVHVLGSKQVEAYIKIWLCFKSLCILDSIIQAILHFQNLCINDAVRRMKSISMINDRCLELQKNKTGKPTPCSGTMGFIIWCDSL